MFIYFLMLLQLEQYGGCEVRTVDYGIYPDHVADTGNFAWRPIVIQVALLKHGNVCTQTPPPACMHTCLHTHACMHAWCMHPHIHTHTHFQLMSLTHLLVSDSKTMNTWSKCMPTVKKMTTKHWAESVTSTCPAHVGDGKISLKWK